MSKKTKILIVDDNENDLLLLEILLKEGGYEVVSAGNGAEALEKLRKDSIDMIISDVLMPGMDGFQFCRECKKDDSLKSIPFVFCTATYTDKKDEEFALSLGSEKIMLKPLPPDVLLDTLKTVFEERRNVAQTVLEIPEKEEEAYLAEYNKRLVEQLEKKVLNLEKEMFERKQAEEKIRKLLHVVEHSSAAIVITNFEGSIEYTNPRFTHLTGYSLEEAVGINPCFLKSGKIHPEVYKELWKTITSGNEWRGEFCNRKKNGELYWEFASISPVKNSEGVITNFIAVKDDITDRKRAEEQLKASLKEKETLLMEIHHRVRNNLQVISSLLLLHTRNLKDEQGIKVFKETQNRIQTMAIVHEVLYKSNHFSRIDFSQFASILTGRLISSYGIDPGRISLEIDIKDVYINIDQAIPLGLLVNELISNSLQHAFPYDNNSENSCGSDQVKQEEYEISISLAPVPDNKIKLIVCDNGVGMPEDLDFRTTDSLGLNLVNIIAEDQLKGEINLDSSVKGAKFQLIFSEKQ